jgi:hypothetical protein
MNDPNPIPKDFGWRYILWATWCGWVFAVKWVWSKALTMLMIVQAVAAAITLDPTLVPHDQFHYLLIVNAVLCALLAQIKRDTPVLKPKE